MTTCRHQAGFTLVEIVVVLAVLSILAGGALPLVGAVIDRNRRAEAESELEALGKALEEYYLDRGAFPPALDDTSFYAVYLQPGVGGTAIRDPFGGGPIYRYSLSNSPDIATVYSVDDNGRDDGAASEDLVVRVSGSVPGLRRTRLRMQWIHVVIANHLDAGGSLTGTWTTDRITLGLDASYERDGFGTQFAIHSATYLLSSAGPDRRFGTADDLDY